MTCKFGHGCKNEAGCTVIHKAVEQRTERKVRSCISCAEQIGRHNPFGALMYRPRRENTYYKIEMDKETCDAN